MLLLFRELSEIIGYIWYTDSILYIYCLEFMLDIVKILRPLCVSSTVLQMLIYT